MALLPISMNTASLGWTPRRGLLLWALLLLLQLSSSSATVKLRMSMKEPYLDLSCEVTNNRRTILLYCPLLGNKLVPCFQGCIATCMKADCSDHPTMRDISCRESKVGNTRIVTFTVNVHNKANKGKWTCGVGADLSAPFFLTPAAPKPTTKPPTPPPPPPQPPQPVVTKPPAKPNPKPPVTGKGDIGWRGGVTIVKPKKPTDDYVITVPKDSTPPPEDKSKLGFWLDLTSPTLVIAVLILLGVSLIVNIAFCVRCILVKKYIARHLRNPEDKYRRGVTDTSCLENCLCIPRARIRGGFKDDLYEDISSTPRVVYSPGGSSKSAMCVDRDESLEFQSLARSRAYSPSSHRSANPATRVGDIYATVVRDPRDPRRGSAAGRYYSPQPPSAAASRVYDDVPESRSLSEMPVYSRPQRLRANGGVPGVPSGAVVSGIINVGGGSVHDSSQSGSSPRHSPDSTGTPSTIALKRVSEHPMEEEAEDAGELIEACTRNDTRLELSKTLLSRADTLLREAGTLLD